MHFFWTNNSPSSSLTHQPSGISALPPTLQHLQPTNMRASSFTSLLVQSPLCQTQLSDLMCEQMPTVPEQERAVTAEHCSCCTREALKQTHLTRRHVLQQQPASAGIPHTRNAPWSQALACRHTPTSVHCTSAHRCRNQKEKEADNLFLHPT